MSRESFENHELPRRNKTWNHELLIYEIFIEKVDKQWLFRKVLKDTQALDADSGESQAPPPKTEALNIILKENRVIELRLRQDVDWCWNNTRAVGRQDKSMNYYFDLLYFDPVKNDWVEFTEERCDRIRFSAEFRGGMQTKNDSMNYNVLFGYPDKTVLPVTIDPDIQNPKV